MQLFETKSSKMMIKTISEGRNDKQGSQLDFTPSNDISIFCLSISHDRLIITIGVTFTYNACDDDCGRSCHDIIVQGLKDLEEEISKLDVTNGESLFGNTINVTINAMSTTFGAISTYKEQDTTFDMISTYEEEDAKFDEDIKYYSTINSHSPS